MVEEQKKDKKSDEKVLFDKADVAGYEVKPWSFGKLFDLSIYLESALNKAESIGLISELNSTVTAGIGIATMAKLFTVANADVLNIICETVNADEEDIKNLSMEDGIKLTFAIYNQNKEVIKNALALNLG